MPKKFASVNDFKNYTEKTEQPFRFSDIFASK